MRVCDAPAEHPAEDRRSRSRRCGPPGSSSRRRSPRMREAVAPGVSTADLDAIAEAVIRDAGARPVVQGLPRLSRRSICSSVNEQVVHAIPCAGQVLREGDLISHRLRCDPRRLARRRGDHRAGRRGRPGADRAWPSAAEDALWAGIAAAARGGLSGNGRLTDISHAVETSVRRSGSYGIVDGYGGHGIGTEMHQDPHVLNHGRPGRGPRLVPGPGAGDRADDHAWARRGPSSWPTGGPW